MSDEKNYGISQARGSAVMTAPELDYLPPMPEDRSIPIGLIGAGNISEYHLKNYKAAGLNVVAICSRDQKKAQQKREQFYPQAKIYTDYRELLKSSDVHVVDITPHPRERISIVHDALSARKHVLSQKPFAEDLDAGEALVKLAETQNVRLAVNQNGRWSPHFRYMIEAVKGGLIGQVTTVDFSLQWDQTWIAGNPGFESIHHMVLWDFAVHWFDMTCQWMMGRAPRSVFASATKFEGQKYAPPALGQAVIDYDGAQVRMGFNAHVTLGEQDLTTITGTKGLLRSVGPSLNNQQVTIYTAAGSGSPKLQGDWFTSGFQGTMGELLCAIEQNREPSNSAKDNLRTLELCFAAIASAERGEAVKPGTVRSLLRK